MLNNRVKYGVSFTAGALLKNESIKVVDTYLSIKDWDCVRKKLLDDNILQARKTSSSTRQIRELILRLSTLTDQQLQRLVVAHPEDQKAILLLAVCKAYPLIFDLLTEKISENFHRRQFQLNAEQVNGFLQRKADWHDELQILSSATSKKCVQVIIRILKEAGLIDSEGRIKTISTSGDVANWYMQTIPNLYWFIKPVSKLNEVQSQ